MTAKSDFELIPFGWAPGGYTINCVDCPPNDDMFHLGRVGAKRCWRCKEHAQELFDKHALGQGPTNMNETIRVPSKTIRILGLDPSLTNTGWVVAEIDIETLQITQLLEMGTVVTAKSKVKSVRKSSDDLVRARQSVGVIRELIDRYHIKIACSEVPSGAQSASAARAFGIVVGILASLTIPLIEVSPTEVKMASAGSKIADKEDIVRWAVSKTEGQPAHACWNTDKRANDWGIMIDGRCVTKTMEHQADAVAGVAAALATNEFKQIAAVLAQLI